MTLSIHNLRFSWQRGQSPLLQIEQLEIGAGERVMLRGPSGSGKSSLLSAIAGVAEIDSGKIEIAGRDVSELRGAARDRFRGDHLGIIFQVFNLVPWLSAIENVTLPCQFSDIKRERAGDPGDAARSLLSDMGLGDEAIVTAPAGQLSVGQQQRVAAARALIGAPELVLADEPTSALDEDARDRFVDLLARACSTAGASLLFVSHDRTLTDRFDRVLEVAQFQPGGAA